MERWMLEIDLQRTQDRLVRAFAAGDRAAVLIAQARADRLSRELARAAVDPAHAIGPSVLTAAAH